MHQSHNIITAYLDQWHSVSVRAGDGNVDQGFSVKESLAVFSSTMGAVKSIIRTEALVLGVDVLALLAWPGLATCTRHVYMVGVEARCMKR